MSAASHLGFKLLAVALADGEGSSSLSEGQGLAVSPASVTLCLALLAGGTKDEQTQEKFYSMLGAGSAEELQSCFSGLLESFRDENDSTITGGNAVYCERRFEVSPEYKRHLELFSAVINTQYDKLADAAEEINSWVRAQTRGMIPELVDRATLSIAHAVLLNALSFKQL